MIEITKKKLHEIASIAEKEINDSLKKVESNFDNHNDISFEIDRDALGRVKLKVLVNLAKFKFIDDKETFKIVESSENGVVLKEVQGDRMKMHGVNCFIFTKTHEDLEDSEITTYNISHLETGMKIVENEVKAIAIGIADERCKLYKTSFEEGIEVLKKLNIKIPVNS